MSRPSKLSREELMAKIDGNPAHHDNGDYSDERGNVDPEEFSRRAREEDEDDAPARDRNGRFAKRKPSTDPESPDFDPEFDGEDLDDFDPEDDEPVIPVKKARAKPSIEDEDIDFEKEVLGRKLKAKVDGVEEEVSVEEMLRSYQKGRAADERLRRASEIEKDVAQRQQQLLELQNRLLEQSKAPKQEEPASKPSNEDAEKELMDAIFSGDEKRAAKAMAERDRALERRLTEEFSRKTIEVEQQAIRKAGEVATARAWQSELSVISEERDDIVADRFLIDVFNAHLAEAVSSKGQTREAIRAAEASFDEWAAERGIKTKAAKGSQREQESSRGLEERARRAEKAKRLSTGTPASAKSKAEQREAPKTGSSLIQEMMAQRKPNLAMSQYGK